MIVHGPAPTADHEAAHSCGKRACINERHLRWATRVENQSDRVTHGTRQYGEDVPSARLKNHEARQIRLDTRTYREIAQQYGVHKSVVSKIKRGVTYKMGATDVPNVVKVPVRIINETETGFLVTQRPHGQDGVWLDKAAVTIPDRAEVKPHHIALVPADLAVRKNLGPEMLESRRAPSPWGRAGA